MYRPQWGRGGRKSLLLRAASGIFEIPSFMVAMVAITADRAIRVVWWSRFDDAHTGVVLAWLVERGWGGEIRRYHREGAMDGGTWVDDRGGKSAAGRREEGDGRNSTSLGGTFLIIVLGYKIFATWGNFRKKRRSE